MPDSPEYFPDLPLSGKHILVTRPDDENNDAFLMALRAMGADVRCLPLIEVRSIAFEWPDFKRFDWLFFTSKNAVKALAANSKVDETLWRTLPMACVGPATEQVLREYGLQAAFVSPVHEAESAARIFIETHTVQESRIFWPCGNRANPHLKMALEAAGAKVTAAVVYETSLRETLTDSEREMIAQPIDVVVFTSPSAVIAFKEMVHSIGFNRAETLIASLGPRTTQAALNAFGGVEIQAGSHTLAALSQAIQVYFQPIGNTP